MSHFVLQQIILLVFVHPSRVHLTEAFMQSTETELPRAIMSCAGISSASPILDPFCIVSLLNLLVNNMPASCVFLPVYFIFILLRI